MGRGEGGAVAFEYTSKSQIQSYFVEVICKVRALLSRNFRYYVNIPDSFFLAQNRINAGDLNHPAFANRIVCLRIRPFDFLR